MIEKIPLIKPVLPYLEKLHQRLFPAWYAASSAKEHVHSEQEILLLPHLVRPGTTVIDVGANNGQYAWHLRRLKCKVEAFEPNPDLVGVLQAAFAKSIAIHQVALSDQAGTGELEIPFSGSKRKFLFGEARIVTDSHKSARLPGYKYVPIETKRLDDFCFENVSFIKIDAEGHELNVLRGSSKILTEQKPSLLIEAEERHAKCAVSSLVSYLSDFNYDGFFLLNRKLFKIAEFNDSLQNLANVATKGLGDKSQYINNFIFIHRQGSAQFYESAN